MVLTLTFYLKGQRQPVKSSLNQTSPNKDFFYLYFLTFKYFMKKYFVTVLFKVNGNYFRKITKTKTLKEAELLMNESINLYGKDSRYISCFVKQIPRQFTWD